MSLVERSENIQTKGEEFKSGNYKVPEGKTMIRLPLATYSELRERFPNDIGIPYVTTSVRLDKDFPKEVVAEMEVETPDRQQHNKKAGEQFLPLLSCQHGHTESS